MGSRGGGRASGAHPALLPLGSVPFGPFAPLAVGVSLLAVVFVPEDLEWVPDGTGSFYALRLYSALTAVTGTRFVLGLNSPS